MADSSMHDPSIAAELHHFHHRSKCSLSQWLLNAIPTARIADRLLRKVKRVFDRLPQGPRAPSVPVGFSAHMATSTNRHEAFTASPANWGPAQVHRQHDRRRLRRTPTVRDRQAQAGRVWGFCFGTASTAGSPHQGSSVPFSDGFRDQCLHLNRHERPLIPPRTCKIVRLGRWIPR